MEIPVYLINGFLESGKTTFIQETLQNDEFFSNEKSLLIVCEEGAEEYDTKLLSACKTDILTLSEEEKLTTKFLKDCQKKYNPQRILIEYNGMWKMDSIINLLLPKDWVIVQIITLADASTFELYLNNMRSMISDHFTNSDMVIFNRCKEDTKQGLYRRSVKAVNRRAQIYFELEDGSPMEPEEEELPFDFNAEIMEIEDEDFGLWYMDAIDHPQKYQGKKVKIRGMVYKSEQFQVDSFVPGRFAMTCCADDVTFIGFLCKSKKAVALQERQWVLVTAEIKLEYLQEYNQEGPVLYAEEIIMTKEPKENLVYFN